MACRNRGYYTHVANMAEIREQVQLYLPVMSRPLVLSRNRILAFTGVYSDITDVMMNAWVWDAREREKIRQSIKRRTRDALLNANNNENYEIENGDMEEGVEEETESVPAKETKPTDSDQKSNKTKRGRFSRISNYQSDDLQIDASPKFKRWSQSRNNNNNYNNQDDYTYSQDNKNPEEDGESEDFGQVDQPEEPKVQKKVPELMITIAAPVFDTKNTTVNKKSLKLFCLC